MSSKLPPSCHTWSAQVLGTNLEQQATTPVLQLTKRSNFGDKEAVPRRHIELCRDIFGATFIVSRRHIELYCGA